MREVIYQNQNELRIPYSHTPLQRFQNVELANQISPPPPSNPPAKINYNLGPWWSYFKTRVLLRICEP